MRIEYVSHATMVIETGDVKIATDPWWEGPAYCGQWHVFPRPVNTDAVKDVDVVLLSHGHEDHLHEPTLAKHLPKSAHVFYPFYWYGGTKGWLEHMGFGKVSEAVNFKTYSVGGNTKITFVANNLDSLVVIENGKSVVVNANDALHAHHPAVIERFITAIRKRWPKIDTVFCGFGGASYFPNTVKFPGKNDVEIAEAREQLFAHNFCRIVKGLAPDVAVPFAADFALLNPRLHWINTARFPRQKMQEYYREHIQGDGKAVTIHDLYSGDVLDNNKLDKRSPYRDRMIDGSLDHLLEEQYKDEIEAYANVEVLDSADAQKLATEIRQNVEDRSALFTQEKLAGVKFCVRVEDVKEGRCYHVTFKDGRPEVKRSNEADADCAVVVDISAPHLRCSFGSNWGGDVVTIGYCADIHVANEDVLRNGLDSVVVDLLTRHPSAKRHMKKQPWRGARFLMQNPLTLSWAVKQVLNPEKSKADNQVYDQNVWLTRTKCEVCRVCDMPMLSAEFANKLEPVGAAEGEDE